MNIDKELIKKGVRQIRESIQANSLWAPELFFQHQRSRSVFGSSSGTSVFCLEALAKYEGKFPKPG